MSRLEVRLVDPCLVAEAWERLAAEVAASPFLRPGWIAAWQQAFGRGRPLVLAAYDENTLAGVLPLQQRWGVVSSPSNWHTPDFGVVSRDDTVTQALLSAAVSMSRRRLELAFIDEGLAQRLRKAAARTHQPVLARVLQRSPRLTLETSFADYLAGQSRNLRRTLRRRRRTAEALGSISFAVHDELDQQTLEEFFRVEASGWKGRNGTAISSASNTRIFYTEVAQWAAGKGWLRLASTQVADRALAGDLSLQCNGVIYVLKTGVDESFADLSPGMLHHHAAIEWAFSQDLRVYDFTGGADHWKMHWTKSTRDMFLVQVFGRGLFGRLDHLAFNYLRPRVKTALGYFRQWVTH